MKTPWQLWSVLFGAILGASLYFSIPAKADTVDNYVTVAWPAVCSTLDEYPTLNGVMGVLQGVEQDTGFGDFDAGRVVGKSVFAYCPRHTGLLQRFIATYAPRRSLV